MARLSKNELASRLAKRLDISKPKAGSVIDGFLNEVLEVLLEGDEVDLGGLLNIHTQDAPPRVRRDRKTGEQTGVPPQRQPKVRISKTLREKVATRAACSSR